MIYAIDWAHKEKNLCVVNEKLEEIKEFLPTTEDIILIETGFPKAKFLKISKNIYVIKGKLVHDSNQNGKSHLEDAKTIMTLYKTQPNLFNKFTEKDILELELLSKFKIYETITKDTARMKNINFAMENEYGLKSEHYNNAIKELEKQKKEILNELEKYFKDKIKLFDDIKGVGRRYLMGILLYANPLKFSGKNAYLAYCGYTKNVCYKEDGKKLKAYNNNVKMMIHQMFDSLIIHKDKIYYPMYIALKEKLQLEHSDWIKGKVDGVAKNKMATKLLIEIFRRIRNQDIKQETTSPTINTTTVLSPCLVS